MHAELVAFLLVLLIGCGAFVFGVCCLLGRFLMLLGRGFKGAFASVARPDSRSRPRVQVSAQVCRKLGCGHVEHRPARFCPRCGSRFESHTRAA